MRAVWAWLLLLGGCFSASDATVVIEYDRRENVGRVNELTLARWISPACDGVADHAPSTHLVDPPPGVLHGVRQACGMIVSEILNDTAIKNFEDRVCDGADTPACGAIFADMFLARLRERYVYANWDRVLLHCRAYPIPCKSWHKLETWARESHNQAVRTWHDAAIAAVNTRAQKEVDEAVEREEAESRSRWRAIAEGLKGFTEGALRRPTTIHCTSNNTGSTTTTECR
ncbi:MAG: hypothetical protein NT062_11065 [Proteobacteria bacterium]|nr:hypothetical protein [Pseudomonadota bacterium]